jgi:hypothetical protein
VAETSGCELVATTAQHISLPVLASDRDELHLTKAMNQTKNNEQR